MMIVHEVILLRLYKRNLINCFLWSLLRKKKQASPLCKGIVLSCLSRAKDLSKRQGSITNPGLCWLLDRKGFQSGFSFHRFAGLVRFPINPVF